MINLCEKAKNVEFSREVANCAGILSRVLFRVEVFHPIDVAAKMAQRLDILKVNPHVPTPL
jgi:hypothetical protein